MSMCYNVCNYRGLLYGSPIIMGIGQMNEMRGVYRNLARLRSLTAGYHVRSAYQATDTNEF